MEKKKMRFFAYALLFAMLMTIVPVDVFAEELPQNATEEIVSEGSVLETPSEEAEKINETEEEINSEEAAEKAEEEACTHVYGAWDYDEAEDLFVRHCTHCGAAEQSAAPEEVTTLLEQIANAADNTEAIRTMVENAVAEGKINNTVAETILGTTAVDTMELGTETTAVQEEKGWYYNTSEHKYCHTSNDVENMDDSRYLPEDITNLINAIGEADSYDAQAELVAAANESGIIANSLKERWCNDDGSLRTEFTNGDYTIKFEKNNDEKTYTAVISGTGNSYDDKIQWSGAHSSGFFTGTLQQL